MAIKLPMKVIICVPRQQGDPAVWTMLTRRGRMSTMSSGTRKITALSFLAMEMANFARKKQ